MKNASHHYQTPESGESQHVLILTQHVFSFVLKLKSKLEQYDNVVHVSSAFPSSLKPFFAGIFINVSERFFLDTISQYDKKLIFLFFDQPDLAQKCHKMIAHYSRGNIKIIHLATSPEHYDDDIEKVFWFCFGRSTEQYLPIHHRTRKQRIQYKPRYRKQMGISIPWQKLLKPRYAVSFILACVVLIHVLFLPVLLAASAFHFQAANQLRSGAMNEAVETAQTGKSLLTLSQNLYSIVRPTFSLFSVGMYPDNVIVLNQAINDVVTTSVSAYRQSTEFSEYFLIQSKSADDVTYMYALKEAILTKLSSIDQDLRLIREKLPNWAPEAAETKKTIDRVSNAMDTIQILAPHLDSLLAREDTKQYLLLFANNMELRPGGGFIGSFGIVTVSNYTIADIQVYDVYDADGQLEAHVRPPAPIRDYLSQPHWFLRDSAFSPDFAENVDQAEYFLQKTMEYDEFDGVVLITTSAVQNLIDALGEVTVSDFDETITRDNFYLKAQLYAESEFFPGSRQKQTFLASVLNEMIISLPEADPLRLQEMLKTSLNEKQIVASFKDEQLQHTLDTQYWSGRTITPECTSDNPNCIVDYIFPYDANLGVNKANFYISRAQEINARIEDDGTVNTTYSVIYRNESHDDVFPGGRYKNYFQILLPRQATVTGVQVDGTDLASYDLDRNEYTRVGFLVTVPTRSTTEIAVSYQITKPITSGSSIYQMIVQKQIGSANSDLKLSVSLPEDVYITNHNFSPVVNENTIVYNTTLAADKIFFIEFFQD